MAATAPADAKAAPALKVDPTAAPVGPQSARKSAKDDTPKSTAAEDIAFLKGVVEACSDASVTRACQTLKWHVADAGAVVAAFQALSALAKDNQKKQLAVQSRGGLTFVVKAMKSHEKDNKVQEEGCNCLVALCEGNDSNANAVAKSGIEVLVDLLKANEKNSEFVVHALGALVVLAGSASGRKEAAKRGAQDLVMQFMKTFVASVKVQERGAAILRHIAADPAGKKAINAKDGITLLKNTRKLFPNSSLLEEHAEEAVKILSAP